MTCLLVYVGLDTYNLTKLKLRKTYGFADEDTRRDFVNRRYALWHLNESCCKYKCWMKANVSNDELAVCFCWYIHLRECERLDILHRDMHQEFHEEFSIPGFVDRILAESEPGVKPAWMSSSVYWLCNVFFMSPCFRYVNISSHSKYSHHFRCLVSESGTRWAQHVEMQITNSSNKFRFTRAQCGLLRVGKY